MPQYAMAIRFGRIGRSSIGVNLLGSVCQRVTWSLVALDTRCLAPGPVLSSGAILILKTTLKQEPIDLGLCRPQR